MVHRLPSILVAVALCCLVGLPALTGVAAATPDVTAGSNETVGDVVTFTVTVSEGANATLVLEATDGTAYSRQVRLTDASGDGEVTLRVNTYLGGGNDSAVYTAGEGDNATVVDGNGTRLTAGRYDSAVYSGSTQSGTPADTASVELTPQTQGTVTILTAPVNATDRLHNRSDVQSARAAGWLTATDEVARNDTLVLELRVDGLGGALAAQSGANDTERFVRMVDQPDTTFEAEELYSTAEIPTLVVPLNTTEGMSVVADPANDTYYVVLDTATGPLLASDRADEDDQFGFRLRVAGETRVPFDEDDDTSTVGLARRTVTLSRPGERATRAVSGNLTVTGQTSVAPGSQLAVGLTTSGGERFTERTVTVDRQGQFDATFAVDDTLVDYIDGVEVSSAGTVLASQSIESFARAGTLTVDPGESLSDGELVLENVTLPEGGYVYVLGSDGTVLGTSEELSPGATESVTVPTDTVNGNQTLRLVATRTATAAPANATYDSAYVLDGEPVGLTVELGALNRTDSTPGAPTTATPATAISTTTAGTTMGTEMPPSTNGTATKSAEGPGFGVVTVIVAAALVAVGTRVWNGGLGRPEGDE